MLGRAGRRYITLAVLGRTWVLLIGNGLLIELLSMDDSIYDQYRAKLLSGTLHVHSIHSSVPGCGWFALSVYVVSGLLAFCRFAVLCRGKGLRVR